jgi:hypothetical protein
MFQKSMIVAAVAGVMAIGLSVAPANAWHRHHGTGVVISIGGGHHLGHKHSHCHKRWKKGHKIKYCHRHRHGHGHH